MTSLSTYEPEGGDELVEFVAREIQLRGLTGPAMLFLEASRPYQPLGSQAMLFFDPVLRGLFGGDLAAMQRVLENDEEIDRLIDRLEEMAIDLEISDHRGPRS
jgi:hypothetical protein